MDPFEEFSEKFKSLSNKDKIEFRKYLWEKIKEDDTVSQEIKDRLKNQIECDGLRVRLVEVIERILENKPSMSDEDFYKLLK